jgi:hypothetical protein
MGWFSPKEIVIEGTAIAIDYGEITYRDLDGSAKFLNCWFHKFPHIREVLHVGDHFVMHVSEEYDRYDILSVKIISSPTGKT